MAEVLDKELWWPETSRSSVLINIALQVVGNTCYLVGSALFWPGAADRINRETGGTWLFILGGLCGFASSIQDEHYALLPLHLQGRPQHKPSSHSGPGPGFAGEADDGGDGYARGGRRRRPRAGDASMAVHLFTCLFSQPVWVRGIITSLGVAANVLFVAGSLLFFPDYAELTQEAGIWLFIIGSIFYLVLVLWDLLWISANARVVPRQRGLNSLLRHAQAALVVGASLAFVVGSVLFFPHYNAARPAVALFIVGSFAFVAASVIAAYKRLWIREGTPPVLVDQRVLLLSDPDADADS